MIYRSHFVVILDNCFFTRVEFIKVSSMSVGAFASEVSALAAAVVVASLTSLAAAVSLFSGVAETAAV